MTDWNGQDLLAPITDDEPCGKNLEDTDTLASLDAGASADMLDPSGRVGWDGAVRFHRHRIGCGNAPWASGESGLKFRRPLTRGDFVGPRG